jgi:hypothetical protein
MKALLVVLLLSGTFLVAQDNSGANSGSGKSKSNDDVTITGCVSRFNGDYVIMKTDPGVSYELQGSSKIRLKNYLGQRVEVTGTKSTTLSSSSDAMAKEGSAAPVTLTVRSIKTIDHTCSERDVGR